MHSHKSQIVRIIGIDKEKCTSDEHFTFTLFKFALITRESEMFLLEILNAHKRRYMNEELPIVYH